MVLGGVSIPVILSVGPDFLGSRMPTIIASVVSAIVAAAAAWEGVANYGQIWLEKRRAAEILKCEGWLFIQRADKYAGQTFQIAAALFAAEVERQIAKEVGEYVANFDVDGRHRPRQADAADARGGRHQAGPGRRPHRPRLIPEDAFASVLPCHAAEPCSLRGMKIRLILVAIAAASGSFLAATRLGNNPVTPGAELGIAISITPAGDAVVISHDSADMDAFVELVVAPAGGDSFSPLWITARRLASPRSQIRRDGFCACTKPAAPPRHRPTNSRGRTACRSGSGGMSPPQPRR
jgi:hypothetical protein